MRSERRKARKDSGDFRLQLPVQWRGRQPEQLGDFRVLDVLGSGGSGTVYLAEQKNPVERRVAIKLLDERFRDTPTEARFLAECQALAQMNHPGIAHIYAAGVTQEGQSFLVMEYIEGPDLLTYCDQHRLSIRERLELFRKVCDAVQHAHHKAFIHRDLKPSNILVQTSGTRQEGTHATTPGQPKVIDFGIAKHLDQPVSDTTRSQGVIGSPLFLSPEIILAAEDESLTPDTRVDIYGLGMVLYKLLLGAHPLERMGTRLVTLVRAILEGDHPPPSTYLQQLPAERREELAALRRVSASELHRCLEGDLDWITLKALQRDREQRYSSATELAADLERHSTQRPVLAGPPTFGYRLGKWLQRHRLATAGVLLFTLLLTASMAALFFESRRANAEAERARAEAATADAVSTFLDDLLRQTDPRRQQGDSLRDLLDRGARQIEVQLADQPEARARLLLTMGQAYSRLQLTDEAEVLLEEALELTRSTHGEESLEQAAALRAVGDLRFRQGQERQAESLLLRALEIQQHTVGAEHPDLVETLSQLVQVLGSSNRLPEAEQYLQQALAIQERHPRLHSQRQAVNLMRLGSLRGAQGNLEEALEHLERARALLEDQHSPNHLLIADVLSNSCQALGRLERAEQALETCQRSLDIRLERLGPDHLETSQSQFNLAALHIDQGRFSEADPLLRDALQTRDAVLGSRHPRTLAVQHALAFSLAAAGTESGQRQAIELYEALVTAQRDVLPPDHPQQLAVVQEYVELLESAGLHERAEPLRQMSTSPPAP